MISRRNKTRWNNGTVAWLAVLLALAVPAPASPPETPLLDRPLLPQATRVMAFSNDGMSQLANQVNGLGRMWVSPCWLSDREMLHARQGTLYRYDITTHADTAMPRLQRQVATSPSMNLTLKASPDAQWVLWGDGSSAAPVDGSRREQWPESGDFGESFWCADSRHWVWFSREKFDPRNPPRNDPRLPFVLARLQFVLARLQDIEDPQQNRTVAVPPGLQGLDLLAVVSEHEVVARTPDPLTSVPLPKLSPSARKPQSSGRKARSGGRKPRTNVSSPGLLSDAVAGFAEQATQTISVWDLDGLTPVRSYRVHLPDVVSSVAVSPQGRAAWLLDGRRGKSSYMSLWVSGLDGSGLHEVGGVPCGPWPFYNQSPDQLQWVPGGKRISFTYNGALWTVPAE